MTGRTRHRTWRRAASPTTTAAVADFDTHWAFQPSRPSVTDIARRAAALRFISPPPRSAMIRPVGVSRRWIAYFVYLPDGQLTAAHRFTLEKLSRSEFDASLVVVCASKSVDAIPDALYEFADALYWKELPGFDFSGYAIALSEIADHSPDADVFVLNDSVLGPLSPIEPFWLQSEWDLTGWTASNQIENHIQSYSFFLRSVDRQRLCALRSILSRTYGFNGYNGVVLLQETRLARVASRHMTAGAFWYGDGIRAGDPSIMGGEALAQAGLPLVKKALFGKHAQHRESQVLHDLLAVAGHPPFIVDENSS